MQMRRAGWSTRGAARPEPVQDLAGEPSRSRRKADPAVMVVTIAPAATVDKIRAMGTALVHSAADPSWLGIPNR